MKKIFILVFLLSATLLYYFNTAGEGQTIGAQGMPKYCRWGLKPLGGYVDEKCTLPSLGGLLVCSRCGDGKCKSIEDKCNCPQDCKNY